MNTCNSFDIHSNASLYSFYVLDNKGVITKKRTFKKNNCLKTKNHAFLLKRLLHSISGIPFFIDRIVNSVKARWNISSLGARLLQRRFVDRISFKQKWVDPDVTLFLIIELSFKIKGDFRRRGSMAYTVMKLAKLSGVSVRTLHWYDKVGLLKPAYHGANGYRYYEEEQLLMLQQILFFRELGFELKQIEKILRRSDFDKMKALSAHAQILQKNVERTKKLIKTIDRTIEHLKGNKKMKDHEIYLGFSKEKQDEYQKYLINRFGDNIKDAIQESSEKIKQMSREDFEKNKQDWERILADLAKLWQKEIPAGACEVQKIIRRHYEWLKNYWTPDISSYARMGEGYTGYEWKEVFKQYDPEHPKFAGFLAEGIKIFADKELA